MADRDDRHVGDELEESNRQIDHIMDLADRADSFKKNHSKSNNSEDKGGSSDNGDPSSSSRANNLKETPNPSGYDPKNEPSRTGSKSAGSGADKGAAEQGATSGAKKGAEAGGKKGLGGLGGFAENSHALKAAKRVAKLVKKLISAIIRIFTFIFGGHVILIIILCIILALLPLLILKAMVTEVCVQITKGVCEIYDDIFGIEGWDEMTSEEKREYCQKKVDAWFKDLNKALKKVDKAGWNLLHKASQWLDDVTDDDTWLGSKFNKLASHSYKKVTNYNVEELMEELDSLNFSYDNTTITTMLVVSKLRELYEDVNTVIYVEDLGDLAHKKYEEKQGVYSVVDFEEHDGIKYEGKSEDAINQWQIFDENQGFNQTNWMKVDNIPIVITGQENFVTMNGKIMGYVEGDKQYLNDCIIYNPYGNKRASLSMTTGSDYELLSHAAYIMACYSVCTPYDEQSVSDLIAKMNDALNRADSSSDKRADIDELCDYDVKFSEVYYGSIVPRLYQPYLYKKTDSQTNGKLQTPWEDLSEEEQNTILMEYIVSHPNDAAGQKMQKQINGEEADDLSSDEMKGLIIRAIAYYEQSTSGYMLGKYEYSYYDPTSDDNTILGMGPSDENTEGYEITVAKGWFDVNDDGEWSKDEEFPIVMQPLKIPEDGEDVFYKDSFCVVTPNASYCNINASPYSKENTMNIEEEKLGFYIYGTNTEEYANKAGNKNAVPYASIDWSAMFQSQYEAQVRMLDHATAEAKQKYIFRFQLPFTRVSSSWRDNIDSDDPASGETVTHRTTPLIAIDATEGSDDYPFLYRMGYVYREADAAGNVILQEDRVMNGGLINGYQTWVYLDEATQREVRLHFDDEDKNDFNQWTMENWATDSIGVPTADPGLTGPQFYDKPFLYQAKMRYMISINVTVIPRYMEYILDCLDYKPMESINHQLKGQVNRISKDDYVFDNKVNGKEMTQGELASGTYEAYMTLLGVKEEEVMGASVQVGSCPTFTYDQMMHILRSCDNADGSMPTPNQKYMVYIALCAAGHVMYEFGGDQQAGLNFNEWMKPAAKHDDRNRMPYEYSGLDCSGFVSWIIKTAFDPSFTRFDTSSALSFTNGTTTSEVRSGTATANSPYGTVFTDSSKLKIGDFAVRRTYDENGNLSGHAALYIGRNPDNKSEQLWIEMTRYASESSPLGQVNGVRVFKSTDYGANRNAVYVRYSDKIPKENVKWQVISPVYMIIPALREIGYDNAADDEWKEMDKPSEPTKGYDPSDSGHPNKNLGDLYGDLSGMVIVLDPGHQKTPNSETEDLAPWDKTQKAKVSAGTKGVATNRPEYEVVLEIALKMKAKLEAKGATVIMTRTTNDVNISNVERAKIATDNNADVFIRLHCDESDNPSTQGIGVFVCSQGTYADRIRKYGDLLGNSLAQSTGSYFRGTTANTNYSGLNWASSVPSFLLEMGYMSNAPEDRLLSDPNYQDKICDGVVNFCWEMKTTKMHEKNADG